tara:strand:- start:100 stop:216 length:117 start_codon:yes stop_codon:yes gene_type:complete
MKRATNGGCLLMMAGIVMGLSSLPAIVLLGVLFITGVL